MFHIEKMTAAHKDQVLPMVNAFYHSSAVDHAVDPAVLTQTFLDAVSADPVLDGFVLMEDESIVGFAYTTTFYACEIGGRCMMFEELFFLPEARGKGYGTAFFRQIMEQHPEVRRFRLEVTDSNEKAIKLYQSLGFDFLNYRQMVLDRAL